MIQICDRCDFFPVGFDSDFVGEQFRDLISLFG